MAMGPADLPRLSEVSIDARSLGFTLLLSLVSGLLFGSIPAAKYARARASAVIPSAGRTASAGRMRSRSRNLLVVAQVAMALVLLVSAVLMIRTFAALRNVDPGFSDAAHVQTMRIWIPDLLVADPETVTHIQNNIADKVAGIPGVTSAGFAAALPMERHRPELGRDARGGAELRRRPPAAQDVQFRVARLFQSHGDKAGRGAGVHLDGSLRTAPSGHCVREFRARIVGLGSGCNRKDGFTSSRRCLG